jgi:hypothetical protein
VLVGYHLMEPFLGIMLDLQPRPSHLKLRVIFQNLYKQMTEPITGLCFSSVKRHALPALQDGFGREYKKEWMASFQKHLERYDANKLENALQILMKHPPYPGSVAFSMSLDQSLMNILPKWQVGF